MIYRALLAKGFKIDIFTRLESGEPKPLKKNLVNVFEIPFERSSKAHVMERDFDEGKSFVEGMVKSSYFNPTDYLCIHTHHWTSGIDLPSYLPESCRLIHTPHLLALEKCHYNGLTCPSYVEVAERKLFDRSEAIFALSNAESDAMRIKYGVQHDKLIVTPNGISPQFFRIIPRNSLSRGKLSLLCVGRICLQKGIDILLDAVSSLIMDGVPTELYLAGGPYGESDYENNIAERIAAPPLRGKVFPIGKVSHSIIPKLLSRCNVYVQPSRYESQGIALVEAMAAGRAVVASNLPAVKEYLTHNSNGLLFEPGNAKALTKMLLSLYSNPDRLKSFGLAARTSARSFTWDKMLERALPIIINGNLK
ncbi:MAG: glycosyltransferase family 4 protein [Chloracidobacterium sp.]|nr:glycosyltransferase family 4 protein [Chloracidobacterium sp.]